jgi:hypothetical protein
MRPADTAVCRQSLRRGCACFCQAPCRREGGLMSSHMRAGCHIWAGRDIAGAVRRTLRCAGNSCRREWVPHLCRQGHAGAVQQTLRCAGNHCAEGLPAFARHLAGVKGGLMASQMRAGCRICAGRDMPVPCGGHCGVPAILAGVKGGGCHIFAGRDMPVPCGKHCGVPAITAQRKKKDVTRGHARSYAATDTLQINK